MNVDNSIKKLGELPIGEAQSHARSGAEKARAGSVTRDNVQISSLWSEIQAPDSQTGRSSVFDATKVDQVKLAISDGRFQLSPEKIAAGLMATVMDLLRARKL